MKYNLFLDDIRFPKTTFNYTKNPIYLNLDWEIVRSYDEFVKLVSDRGLPEIVSFDHDLAEEHYHGSMYQGAEAYKEHLKTIPDKDKKETGYDCVKWLVDYCIKHNHDFPMWYLHTMNPVGMENMKSYILSYLKNKQTSSCACGGDCGCNN